MRYSLRNKATSCFYYALVLPKIGEVCSTPGANENIYSMELSSDKTIQCKEVSIDRRVSSVDIEPGCGLDERGSIPGKGKTFLFFIALRTALRPDQASYPMDRRGSFTGGEAEGA